MKRTLLLLLAFVSTILTASAQWELQTNPLGYGNSAMIGKIQFVSPTEGWISASKSGKLLHTTDGGNYWNIVDPFPEITTGSMSDPGQTMSWPTASRGYVLKSKLNGTNGDFMTLGNGAVFYKTVNGGTNWTKQELPKTITSAVYSNNDLTGTWQVHGLQSRNTNISNSVSKWLHGTCTISSNGSSTFSLVNNDGGQSSGNKVLTVNSRGRISVDDLEIGFLSADKNTMVLTFSEERDTPIFYFLQKEHTNTTYSTSDLQGIWQMHSLSAGNSLGAHSGWGHATLSCDATGAISGNFDDVENSGTIQSTLTIDANGNIGGMSNMATAFYGYLSADKNTIYATMTGKDNTDYNLVAFQRQQTGMTYSITDLKGVWRTQSLVSDNTNDVDNWSGWMRNQFFINSKGDASMMDFIANGEDRNEISVGFGITSTGVISFNGIDKSNGFLSADKNLMIFTTPDMDSGGYTFGVMQRDLSISGDLGLQIQFINENTGWMSNYNPVYETFNIYKTTDGGINWDSAHANAGGLFHFVDAKNGWMIGSMGENIGEDNISNILHTTDGGTTWQLQASNIGRANAIQFTDALNGWVVGDDGLIMHTTDGGAHWSTVTIDGFTSSATSKTLYFLDADHGWISFDTDDKPGDEPSFVLATKNGGLTWQTQATPVLSSIFSISAYDANHVWFTSDYGQIACYNAPKTLNITAGGLNDALDPTEIGTLKALVLTGTMDARDFKVLRDKLPELESLDLSGSTIVAYSGAEGTVDGNYTYPGNTTPRLALCGHSKLKYLTLPNNLVSIGRSSFNSCAALSGVELPSSLQLVDSLAFAYCSGLKQLVLPQSMKRLAYGAFLLSGIEQLSLNEGLTRIEEMAFQQCDSLRNLYISSTVNSISPYALFCVNSLETIGVAPNNPNFCSENGVLYTKDRTRLLSYPAAKSCHFDIPNGVTTIDTAAFAGNWKLISVSIPSTVTEIVQESFEWCSSLAVLDIPTSISKIGVYSFYGCNGLSAIFTNSTTPIEIAASDSIFGFINTGCTLYVPKGSSAAYATSEGWSKSLNRIKEYEKVTDVEGNVYHGIQIGTQTWLVENLRTRHFNNNNPIPTTPEPDLDLTDWPGANFGWDLYNDPTYSYVYGRLYTWNAATDQRGISPYGYKIPSAADWQTLIDYVSSHNITSTTKALAAPGLWYDDPDAPEKSPSNTTRTNNESGFLAFPTGIRHIEGYFEGNFSTIYLWSTDNSGYYSDANYIDNIANEVKHELLRSQEGFSIRCVKDPNVALETVKDANMDICPNPANTDFAINGLQGKATITITNMNGQALVTKAITDGQHISVADLADGMYLVTIRTNAVVKTKPLIVRHGR